MSDSTKWINLYSNLTPNNNTAYETLLALYNARNVYLPVSAYVDACKELGYDANDVNGFNIAIAIAELSEEKCLAILESRVFNGEWLVTQPGIMSERVDEVLEYLEHHETKMHIDMNRKDDLGKTAIMVAIKESDADCDILYMIALIDKMIAMGAKVHDVQDEFGVTPLLLAITSRQIDLIDHLIRTYRVDVHATFQGKYLYDDILDIEMFVTLPSGRKDWASISVPNGATMLDVANLTNDPNLIQYMRQYFTKPTKSAARF